MYQKFLLTNTSGKKSSTLTAFVLGFIIVNIKLLLSGLTIGDYTMSEFTGVDYGACLSALGAIYVLRRNSEAANKPEQENTHE